MRRRALALGLATATALLVGVAPAAAQTVRLAPFGGETFDSPYYVTGDPGDPSRVFVAEGEGTIRLVKDGVTQSTFFLDISADVCSSADGCGAESGLFSMAPAPDYSASGRFYVYYTADVNPGTHLLRIEEFRRSPTDPDIADPGSRRIVLEIDHPNASNHNGGQLQFGADKLLYAGTGDGGAGQSANAQNRGSLLGKLLRINPGGTTPGEYSIPADNPFAGATAGADQVYSYGLRNPYRFSFDRLTGDLTIGDVGQGSWEEIDFMPSGTGRGANFGWDCFEGFAAFSGCSVADYSPPVLVYPRPSGGAAVNGGYVIRDGALPSLLGRYIYADTYDVFGGELRTARLFAGGSSGDSGLGVFAANVVSFGEDACAHIYVATLGGNVYRLEPTNGPFPCMPQNPPGAQGPAAQGPGDQGPNGAAPPTCRGKPATFVGTPGNDVRNGTSGRDVMLGLAGRDRLFGLGGNDVICGAKGKDTLKGGSGNDFLGGQKGDDELLGKKGKDKLSGKAGRDRLQGGGGKDELKGGGGRDVCIGGKANDSASKCEVERSI